VAERKVILIDLFQGYCGRSTVMFSTKYLIHERKRKMTDIASCGIVCVCFTCTNVLIKYDIKFKLRTAMN